MKKVLKAVVALVFLVGILGAGGFVWAKGKAGDLLNRTIDVHAVDFPIPFPLDPAEVAEAGFTAEQADSVALQRALTRGRHLVEARYVCVECHGKDFAGGVMVDDPMLGRLLGPNITAGAGGKTAAYTAGDWDRIVRHGVRPDGTPSAMPAEDFRRMSDRELSDIVAFVQSHPAVDADVPPVTLGPLGTVLVATGALPLSADIIGDHTGDHVMVPPAAAVTVEFGEHLAGVCAGCHKTDLSGGKVAGGDPSWPEAPNLTPMPDGLGAWTLDQFRAFLREGVRPDGTMAAAPMDMVVGYSSGMTETEMDALWMYLRSLPPTPTGS